MNESARGKTLVRPPRPRRSVAEENGFGLKRNVKSLLHSPHDIVRERGHILTCSAARIDENERMLVVNRCAAAPAFGRPLEAAGVDQPAGGELHAISADRIRHEAAVLREKFSRLHDGHDRVFEKTARAAYLGRIGELFGAYCANSFCNRIGG